MLILKMTNIEQEWRKILSDFWHLLTRKMYFLDEIENGQRS